MEPRIIPINHQTAKSNDSENISYQIRMGDVFTTRTQNPYLNEFTLFSVYFNAIPNFIHEFDIDCKKANIWFSVYYKSEIKDSYFSRIYFGQNKKAELD